MLSSKQRVGNERSELCEPAFQPVSPDHPTLLEEREREREQNDHFITRKSSENLSSLKGLKDHGACLRLARMCAKRRVLASP